MAGMHKQMPSKTYHIAYREDGSSTVECTYLCPYCDQVASVSFEAKAGTANRLEQGGFFEELRCDRCGEVTDVRFWKRSKI